MARTPKDKFVIIIKGCKSNGRLYFTEDLTWTMEPENAKKFRSANAALKFMDNERTDISKEDFATLESFAEGNTSKMILPIISKL